MAKTKVLVGTLVFHSLIGVLVSDLVPAVVDHRHALRDEGGCQLGHHDRSNGGGGSLGETFLHLLEVGVGRDRGVRIVFHDYSFRVDLII